MDLESQLLHRIDDPALSRDERARLRCELAKRLEEAGDYGAAREAMSDLWPHLDERPQVEGLDGSTAAEVLLRAGALVGWIGSIRQIADAQERAKDLISESIRAFEALQDRVKVAEALTDLAYCYWREGAFDEARVTLRDALSRLGEDDIYQRGVALVRSAIVEKEATRYGDALHILTDAAPTVEASGSHALNGKFHNELATVLKDLGAAEHREDYTDRALIEYAAASFHFEQAGHVRYHACVENNLGYLYLMGGHYAESHEHLDRARRLLVSLKDRIHTAQVDETRARVLLAEGRNSEAEGVIRAAVRTLEDGGQQHLLAEALTTHGTALARLGSHKRARLTLQSAVEVAEQAGDPEGAGQAALTIIEELGDYLSPGDLSVTYERAVGLLAASQYPSILTRLNSCARRVLRAVSARNLASAGDAGERAFHAPVDWREFSFWREVRRYEHHLIEHALKDAGGLVTRAAELLGFKHHQSLSTLLNRRHKDLLYARSPVVPRKHGSYRKRAPRSTGKCSRSKKTKTVRILHVEDYKMVAEAVKDTLEMEGWRVVTCSDGARAVRRMASQARYSLMIFDNHLPNVNGVELVRFARQLPHRQHTPIIMLSASDAEREVLNAGADAFLRKPEDIGVVVETVTRLLNLKAGGQEESG
jgi:two-component system chemotaxis response regulator CheY